MGRVKADEECAAIPMPIPSNANHSHTRLAFSAASTTMKEEEEDQQQERQMHSVDQSRRRANEREIWEARGSLEPVRSHCVWRAQKRTTQPIERLFLLISLPFLFAFLLPSIRLEPRVSPPPPPPPQPISFPLKQQEARPEERLAERIWRNTERATSDLLLALIRLPLERLRLQSGGSLVGALAKEISSKSDLQEEETHMLMLAPAEHRTSYVPAPSQVGGAQAYQYGAGDTTHVGPQEEAHAQPNSEYGGQAGDEQGGAPGAGQLQPQAEASVVSDSASSGASGSALQARSDLPAVRALNVKCEKNHMTVNIVFDRPFYGMVFSKGHYNDQKCVHLPPNSGQTSVNFDIHLGRCGMSSSDASGQLLGPTSALQQAAGAGGQQPNGVYIENTIIIQYDPLVQEIFDQARKLRCTWYDYYEKSVTFRPYNVDMLDAVTANFLGDNIQCWMQIQVGKGPWSSEVAGIVKIGQTMTMVLAIKDDENRFDMLVRNCVAHDGKHQPIQLVDEYGCVARPKIMGRFQKVRNFGPAATVVSYAHFQAFKFPDSMSVHFQCVIQVCRGQCPEPSCSQPAGELAGPTGGAANQNGAGSAADYATSGTEMIASKEPLPGIAMSSGGGGGGGGGSFFNGLTSVSPTMNYANQSHGSNVNLKLDDSQGRVQVKLDTSMMAGLNGRPPQTLLSQQRQSALAAGPLPPHLLHMASNGAAEQAAGSGRASYLGAAYYRPVVATSSSGGQQASAALVASGSAGGAPGAGLMSRQHGRSQPLVASGGASLGAVAAAAAAPSVGAPTHHHQAQIVSYSPQYGSSAAAARRSTAAFASRLGELAPSSEERESQQRQATAASASAAEYLQISAPYEADHPLSLLGSPRGLKLGAQTGSEQHRFRRNVQQQQPVDDKLASTRRARNSKSPDSTSIQTQKTIQVVSPDDVAFSLLDPSEDPSDSLVNGFARTPRTRPPATGAASAADSICFSASRFLWGVLVTVGALVSSIVIVTYVILKQRSQLHRKFSAVFAAPPDQMSGYCNTSGSITSALEPNVSPALSDQQLLRQNIINSHQQQQQQLHHHSLNEHQARSLKINSTSSLSSLCGPLAHTSDQRRQQRQRDEIQQRNTYLSRLYSQFAPANYWR